MPSSALACFYSAALAWNPTGVDNPHIWLADVIARIADHPARRLDELLPWNWGPRAS